jgi:hypothetical protein
VGRPRIRPVEAPLDPVTPLAAAALRRKLAASQRQSARIKAKLAAEQAQIAARAHAEQDRIRRAAEDAAFWEARHQAELAEAQRRQQASQEPTLSPFEWMMARAAAERRQPRFY